MCFLLIQHRRGKNIAVWAVPAETFEQAVFAMRLLDEHRAGDDYFRMGPR